MANTLVGYSGADLTSICQKACKLAVKESIEFDKRQETANINNGAVMVKYYVFLIDVWLLNGK